MGLDPDKKFEVHTARFALRTKPDGGVVPQLLVTVLQAAEVPADDSDPDGPKMIFEGGSSIVADLQRKVVKYCIRKKADEQRAAWRSSKALRCRASPALARLTHVRIPTIPRASPLRSCIAECE